MMDQKATAKQPTLPELFKEHLSTFERPEYRANFLRHKCDDMIGELKRDRLVESSPVQRELMDYRIELIGAAVKCLEQMATEQYRQREATRLFLYGRLDRGELNRIVNSWNGEQ